MKISISVLKYDGNLGAVLYLSDCFLGKFFLGVFFCPNNHIFTFSMKFINCTNYFVDYFSLNPETLSIDLLIFSENIKNSTYKLLEISQSKADFS